MLMVLDEAQVLADAAHTDLAHALRAGLDRRKDTIKVVFAGSSEPTLRRMFGRAYHALRFRLRTLSKLMPNSSSLRSSFAGT